MDFPGGPVVKNSAANAGDMGLIPGPGRFHMQLSPSANYGSPHTLEPMLCNKKSHFSEKSARHNEE